MENYLVVLAAAGAAAAVIGGGYAVYQLFRLAETDARCRGMKHPRLWGLLASSGSNQSGLLLYLIRRKNHPVLSLSEEEKGLIQRRKRKIGVGIAFLVAGAVMLIWGFPLLGGMPPGGPGDQARGGGASAPPPLLGICVSFRPATSAAPGGAGASPWPAGRACPACSPPR